MNNIEVLGIDFGGSGIKGAPVNIKTGVLLEERHRIPTPIPATPKEVAIVIKKIVKHFNWKGAVGVGFPAVVLNGIVKTASNIDKSWIGVNAEKLFSKSTGLPVKVVNDADSAGMAERRFGIGKKVDGTVVLLTVGTGIGSAVFIGKKLVPNTELGHIYLDNGLEGEKFAADSVRQNEKMEWDEWGTRFNKYLEEIEKLFWPELIIVGGGMSKRAEKFLSSITIKTPIEMAQLRNEAGIIGAAVAAKPTKKMLKQLEDSK